MDLGGYLARIGLHHRPATDAVGLAQIQRAQRLSIPFENLDILLGRGVSLDPEAVFDKLVTARRGGYCFEQNQLLGRALDALGFETRPLLGRVWIAAPDFTPPRTHTLPLVMQGGEAWIADAGFGTGYAPPMRVRAGEVVTGQDGIVHRMREHPDHGWMIERANGADWQPQYSFTLDMVHPLDLEMSNHWTSSWPQSRFVNLRITSIMLPTGMASLMNETYTRTEDGKTIVHEITDTPTLKALLSDVFGITLSLAEIERLGAF
jgi:N-hydroxyarylamine O-acetyltransferase